jgi:hypothetical protein
MSLIIFGQSDRIAPCKVDVCFWHWLGSYNKEIVEYSQMQSQVQVHTVIHTKIVGKQLRGWIQPAGSSHLLPPLVSKYSLQCLLTDLAALIVATQVVHLFLQS